MYLISVYLVLHGCFCILDGYFSLEHCLQNVLGIWPNQTDHLCLLLNLQLLFISDTIFSRYKAPVIVTIMGVQ